MASVAAFTSIAIVFGALNLLEYSYYVYLRILACGTAIVLFASIEAKRFKWLRLPLSLVVILYNFAVPIHLPRSAWLPIDFITALLFMVSIYPAMLSNDEFDGKRRTLGDRISDAGMRLIDSAGWLFATMPITSLCVVVALLIGYLLEEHMYIPVRKFALWGSLILLFDAYYARKESQRRERELMDGFRKSEADSHA